ncbi:PREDICTED: larval cuticle protein A2B-like [Nicrophorus vespilloides]|uniref:Larval cuticle protein A2B-like n=1 Tax=Nicrophorus vespilloides TaxID=110193 RepID=A0ABM1MF03_NICVS|nr:PREDICTED: larval cuticle protein A2B-like [Nicrophorus vespilloides]
MFAKILAVSALVACAQAGVIGVGHHATSYSSLSDAPVTHYASAPVAGHYAAPIAAYHHAPAVVKAVVPVAHYAAPVAAYHAAPVAAYHHVPADVKAVAPVAHYAAPIVKSVHQEVYPDTHPEYSYQYGVQDAHTGDVKNQHEERDGDVVKGYYTLVQPDGVTRTVHYTADAHNGFNAEVEYKGEPIVQKAVVAKTIVAAAPVYKAYHH